jgi:flap endonuclease-1
MGIKHLNRYLLRKCRKTSIKTVSLQNLAGKTVVIDTFIYIYKFLGEDKLLENMNRMVTTLKQYRITPIFVFDGKPPEEKRCLLLQRFEKKKEAECKYREIIQQIETGLDKTSDIDMQLNCLKKQFLRVDYGHIQCVKAILREHGVEFIDAEGESDIVCTKMVASNKAWACMSDDMDMFVYGTPRVLREFSLEYHSAILYNLYSILGDLNMTMRLFRQIMVLSGTDYNINDNVSLHETLKWYGEYRKWCIIRHSEMDFYDWLLRHTKYIQDYNKLQKVYGMFTGNLTDNPHSG